VEILQIILAVVAIVVAVVGIVVAVVIAVVQHRVSNVPEILKLLKMYVFKKDNQKVPDDSPPSTQGQDENVKEVEEVIVEKDVKIKRGGRKIFAAVLTTVALIGIAIFVVFSKDGQVPQAVEPLNTIKSVEREGDTLKIRVSNASGEGFLSGSAVNREDENNFTVDIPQSTKIVVPSNVSEIITDRDNLTSFSPKGGQYGKSNERSFTPGQTIHFSGAGDSKVKIILNQ
jgi:hypothetical protein